MNTAGMFAESGWWLRSVVENSSEIITVLDPDGSLRYASPAFARILGYSLKEAVGTNFLDYLHPEDLPHVLEKSEKAFSEGGVARNVAELSTAFFTRTAPGVGWKALEHICSMIRRYRA